MSTVRIWDLPTRLFHWSLVVLIATAIITANIGGNAMVWHFRCGYAILTLLLFRIVWGLVGSHYARFKNFSLNPKAALAYLKSLPLKKENSAYFGHNPLGSWSVVVVLLLLLIQIFSGFFSNDDIASEGPWAHWVSEEVSSLFSEFHEINSNLIYVWIGVHILAILFYRFYKRDNLVKPMLTGDKEIAGVQPLMVAADNWKTRIIAAIIFAAAIGFVQLLIQL